MTSRSALFAARLEEMAARHRQTDLEVTQARKELLAALTSLKETAKSLDTIWTTSPARGFFIVHLLESFHGVRLYGMIISKREDQSLHPLFF